MTQSVRQYEMSQRLKRSHVQAILSAHLQHKSIAALEHVLPDVYNGAPLSPTGNTIEPFGIPSSTKGKSTKLPNRSSIAPRLLPAVRNLKWSIRRDALARTIRSRGNGSSGDIFLRWHGLWQEDERVRLAICPGVGKIVRYFENLAAK